MKNGRTEHYWRIHKKVATRILSDLTEYERHVIASDHSHATPLYKWFEEQTFLDAERLYTDSDYYENAKHSFRYPRW